MASAAACKYRLLLFNENVLQDLRAALQPEGRDYYFCLHHVPGHLSLQSHKSLAAGPAHDNEDYGMRRLFMYVLTMYLSFLPVVGHTHGLSKNFDGQVLV